MIMNYNELPDITLKMIIDSGLIKPGTKVFAAPDNDIIGTINEDGSISLTIENKQKVFPFPSGAARAIVKISVNGWLFWRIKESGQFKELSHFKKEYIKQHS